MPPVEAREALQEIGKRVDVRERSQCLHRTCGNEGWPAGRPADYSGGLGGSPRPLLASEVLIHSLFLG